LKISEKIFSEWIKNNNVILDKKWRKNVFVDLFWYLKIIYKKNNLNPDPTFFLRPLPQKQNFFIDLTIRQRNKLSSLKKLKLEA